MNPVAARRADAERTILEATLADPMVVDDLVKNRGK